MKIYKDLLVDGLQDRYQEILKRPVNEEGLSRDFLEVDRARSKGILVEPVSRQEHNAALLCQFVDEYERGEGISPATLEFLYHTIVDVLEGELFDEALPIPRERRPDEELKLLAEEQGKPKKYEIGRAIAIARRNGHYKSIPAVCEVIGPLWNVTPETAEQYYKAWKARQNQVDGRLSSNRRGKTDT